MAEENFSDNLLRLVAAELHLLNGLTVAREMFGRGYFSLGLGEKAAVDQAVFALVQGNYQAVSPGFLASQEARPAMGYPTQASTPTSEKS